MAVKHFEVDRSLCQGHNRCMALAPDVFEPDDDGYAIVLDGGVVPPDLADSAEDVVLSCPEDAIRLLVEER